MKSTFRDFPTAISMLRSSKIEPWEARSVATELSGGWLEPDFRPKFSKVGVLACAALGRESVANGFVALNVLL